MPGTCQSRLSRLMIGTAQFGSSYGVANRSGAPAMSEVCRILDEAAAAGINCLDTAAAYGDSEKVLGKALAETALKDSFSIVTKTDICIPPGLSSAEARTAIRLSVERSLKRLRIDSLFAVLLHRDESPAYLDALEACRDNGLIGRSGISFLEPAKTTPLLDEPNLQAIQIPANVLDRRFAAFAADVRRRDTLVFARSTYLQGLLLIDDASTPQHLLGVKSDRALVHSLAADLGLSPAALLLRATLDHPEIDSVVVGMENCRQLQKNLAIFHSPVLPPDTLQQLAKLPSSTPPWILDPYRWDSHATLAPAGSE